jgi:5-methylcytosine-specific restriction endonuclease McrA
MIWRRAAQLYAAGSCVRCYARQAHSRRRFAGHRDAVLDRDGRRCRACGSDRKLVVHHRRPGIHQRRLLITLCAACHARVHRLRAMRRWLKPALVLIWHEQHPTAPVQLQFDWSADT